MNLYEKRFNKWFADIRSDGLKWSLCSIFFFLFLLFCEAIYLYLFTYVCYVTYSYTSL